MSGPPEFLFLTGGTGLIGRMTAPMLKKNCPERRIVTLVRSPRQAAQFHDQGISTVIGDLTQPRVGLSGADYRMLSENVTGIIHSAATVQFDLPLEESRRVNLEGTRKVLELARSCARLRRLAHISTTYVNGVRPGIYAEEPMAGGQTFLNSYQQSKFEAECLIVDAMAELPAAIYRLPAILADSAQGVVSQFGYLHHLFRVLPQTALPLMPGDPETRIDVVPADWIAASLAYLFDFRFTPGSVRHLCAGPDEAIPIQVLIERACAVIESHPSHPAGLQIRPPRIVPLTEFEDFLGSCPDRRVRIAAAVVGRHIRLMGVRQSYLVNKTRADLEGCGHSLPDMVDCLARTIRYCLDTNWGGKGPVSYANG